MSFIPAIFTTARLWATDIDIASDPIKGEVDFDSSDVTPRPWLWFQYHVSPGLQHTVDRQVPKDSPFGRVGLGNLLELEYARTIAVVGADGIDAFLTSGLWTW